MSVQIKELVKDEGASTTIIWASRHDPLPEQLSQLRERLGPIRVVKIEGIIPSAEWLAEKARELNAKYIVPVLPLSMIARLAELSKRYGFTLLYAKMEEIAKTSNREEAEKLVKQAPTKRTAVEYSGGLYRVWEFKCYEKIVKVELVTEPF